jgi:hypothetical protein
VPAPIEFVCLNPKHPPRRITISGFVTIYESAWAFCPEPGVEDHQWRRIQGRALSEVVRRLPSIVELLRRDADGPLGPVAEIEGLGIAASEIAHRSPAKSHATPR